MIFVFDTNTLVSAILKPQSIPAKALEAGQNLGKLIFSIETISELQEVISRSKFNNYLPLKERIEKAETLIAEGILIVPGQQNLFPHCRDPKDIKFLTLTLNSQVDCLVSGDIHLTELHPLGNIPILNPKDFLIWSETTYHM